jgi:hypothetical protein
VDVSLLVVPKSEENGQKEDMLRIRVTDTGIGISDENKKRIFDRFFQVEGQDVNTYGGSGIGLSMVKDYVEMHDGNIIVSDHADRGTVFTIHIPIRHDVTLSHLKKDEDMDTNNLGYIANDATIHDGKAQSKSVSQGGEVTGRGEYEVLLVDDSQDFIDFMTSVMSEYYRVRVAFNGKEAM